jgi:hypothetical protein
MTSLYDNMSRKLSRAKRRRIRISKPERNIRSELAHIEETPSSIKSIKHPSLDEMMLAIDLSPNSIQYFVEEASDELRWRALELDPTVIQWFEEPTTIQIKYVIRRLGWERADELIHHYTFVGFLYSVANLLVNH